MGGWRRFVRLASLGTILVLPLTAALASDSSAASTATVGVVPNAVNNLDCNGHSSIYQPIAPSMGMRCTDPFFTENGIPTRAYDNGHYVGHDEPSVKFISTALGSGNHMTYFMQLAVDPKSNPTPSGSVTDYAELSVAPWFGLPICDPESYPFNHCTPDSDQNTGIGLRSDAGSAFEELQFYAPGFGPFSDAVSCDQTRYCAALNIDSLECTFNFRKCNFNCIEPVNFAFLTRDGVPTGPPSPQLANGATFLANTDTLFMNPGDKLKVTLQDTPHGLKTSVNDLTTGQSGSMVASAANGFMNTDFRTCNGIPFDFHPEYSTARQQNQVPWAALEGGVLMQQEIGHFESCNSVGGGSLGIPFDPAASWTCNGGIEPASFGEGPCTSNGCANATTEGGLACPNQATALCELSDAECIPKGTRTTTIAGSPTSTPQIWTWRVAGCIQAFTQNGDLDFDGNDYIKDWPDGSSSHPTAFNYAGPFDANGNPYPNVQIETDLAASEQDCNVVSGAGCTAPPHGAQFYPFWTTSQQSPFPISGSNCVWNFGTINPGVTSNDLGGDTEYGAPDTARFAGTLISAPVANPQLFDCTA
jgi:hypothetical protein